MKKEFLELAGLEAGDTIFFMADKEERAAYFAGQMCIRDSRFTVQKL